MNPLKKVIKATAGLTLAITCPPAAAIVGTAVVLKSARQYAQSGDSKDAEGMFTGYSDSSGGSQETR